MVRAERIFPASPKQQDIPAKPEAIRRSVALGMRAKVS
jgi:hypothetical protein